MILIRPGLSCSRRFLDCGVLTSVCVCVCEYVLNRRRRTDYLLITDVLQQRFSLSSDVDVLPLLWLLYLLQTWGHLYNIRGEADVSLLEGQTGAGSYWARDGSTRGLLLPPYLRWRPMTPLVPLVRGWGWVRRTGRWSMFFRFRKRQEKHMFIIVNSLSCHLIFYCCHKLAANNLKAFLPCFLR